MEAVRGSHGLGDETHKMMSTNRKERPTAMVTGASDGIGREFADLLGAAGYDLVLVARRETRLHEIAADLERRHAVRVTPLPADLVDASLRQGLLDELEARSIQVDVLINNAGFGGRGEFEMTDWETEQRMIALNIVALTHFTKYFATRMAQRGSGHILNVASTAGFQPCPFMSVYAATKAYVLSFTEAVSQEFRHKGVLITALCPGATATSFARRASVEDAPFFRLMPVANARAVAERGYRAMMRGRVVVTTGVLNNFMAFLVRLLPRRVVAFLAGRTMQ